MTCLCCPDDPPANGFDDGGSADECGWFDDDSADGNIGLHGEWELAEVLVEAPMGTPAADGYKSWLN